MLAAGVVARCSNLGYIRCSAFPLPPACMFLCRTFRYRKGISSLTIFEKKTERKRIPRSRRVHFELVRRGGSIYFCEHARSDDLACLRRTQVALYPHCRAPLARFTPSFPLSTLLLTPPPPFPRLVDLKVQSQSFPTTCQTCP